MIRLHDREDGPAPMSDAGANVGARGRGSGQHDIFVHDISATDAQSVSEEDESSVLSGDLHREDLAAKGRLTTEDMERAMEVMSMGRSPVSGNPINGLGRFG